MSPKTVPNYIITSLFVVSVGTTLLLLELLCKYECS